MKFPVVTLIRSESNRTTESRRRSFVVEASSIQMAIHKAIIDVEKENPVKILLAHNKKIYLWDERKMQLHRVNDFQDAKTLACVSMVGDLMDLEARLKS